MDDETISSSELGKLLNVLSKDKSETKDKTKFESSGTVVMYDQNGLAWCQLEGSEEGELTPVENLTMTTKVGDNIQITIEDGVATGKPSTNNQMATAEYVNALVSALSGDTSALEEYLTHGNFEDITAQKASFGEMEADTGIVRNLTADTAYVTNLEANNAVVNSIKAVSGKFDSIEATTAKLKKITAEWIKAARLDV